MNAPESVAPLSSALPRLPAGPFPGLRPFQEHEEILLFGRERHVREVIQHLKETQFVAVIGGSGSGKSSLVLAGAMPALRSFGIPGAGDFWVPLVCTPGTNASLEDQQALRNTPITRLARKFAALLKSRGSPQADEDRIDGIASLLRKERGLAHVVRAHSGELNVEPGPDPEQARFLFVLDQFEELFHPTTRRSHDAELLIERVIEHFFSPHERCYVVLTMRSEYLNDCAGFLELPDAINKSSYLVRRLDANELRAAITGPVERLLRLHLRQSGGDARLPASITFDDVVLKRLLKDTQALSDNPDHLPLLQHVLARAWHAAVQRVSATLDLPDRITHEDLALAVTAKPGAAVPQEGNVLVTSVEQWAERSRADLDAADAARLDRLLPRLGVKDPNTGMYSQERIGVDVAAALLSLPGGRDELARLLRHFLDPVEYLFWDSADPARVTLKVSHESFIRAWPRLRQAIDGDAERFSTYADVLRKAHAWVKHNEANDDLLESADLRKADNAKLAETLADPDARARWARRVEATHALSEMATSEPRLGEYLSASRRNAWFKSFTTNGSRILAVVSLALLLAYFTLVQNPVLERASQVFRAGALANATPRPATQAGIGSPGPSLRTALEAVDELQQARNGESHPLGRALLEHLSALPFVKTQRVFVRQAIESNEPVVNGTVRELLQRWIWNGNPAAPGTEVSLSTLSKVPCWMPRPSNDPVADHFGNVPLPEPAQLSLMLREARGRIGPRMGYLLTANNPKAGPEHPAMARASRAVFVPLQPDRSDEAELRAATVIDGVCISTQPIASLPYKNDPVVAFDANLRNLMFSARRGSGRALSLIQIDWEQRAADYHYSIDRSEEVVVTSPQDAQRFDDAVARQLATVRTQQPDLDEELNAGSGADRRWRPVLPATLKAKRVRAGRQITVGDAAWRVVDEMAQRLDGAEKNQFEELTNDSQPACAALAKALAEEKPGFRTRGLHTPRHPGQCFLVREGKPVPEEGQDGVAAQRALYHLQAAVYPMPTLDAQGKVKEMPRPIASMPAFSRTPELNDGLRWLIGTDEMTGWLGLQAKNRLDEVRRVASPWSTCALWRLGHEILRDKIAGPNGVPASACRDS